MDEPAGNDAPVALPNHSKNKRREKGKQGPRQWLAEQMHDGKAGGGHDIGQTDWPQSKTMEQPAIQGFKDEKTKNKLFKQGFLEQPVPWQMDPGSWYQPANKSDTREKIQHGISEGANSLPKLDSQCLNQRPNAVNENHWDLLISWGALRK